MKTGTLFIVILATVVAAVVGVTFSEIQGQENKVIFTKPDDIGTGKVLGIHQYSLKEGVDPLEFERFVAKELSLVLKELWPGVQISVLKGERGSKIGQYIMVYEMNSLYVRNYYFPGNDTSEAAKAIWEDCGERCNQVWNRLGEMAERLEYTDYVALVK